MPADFPAGAATDLTALKSATASALGWRDKVEDIADRLIGANNDFGEAAVEDVGTAAGEVPELDSTGRLLNQIMPRVVDVDGVSAGTPAGSGIYASDNRRTTNIRYTALLARWITTPSRVLISDSSADGKSSTNLADARRIGTGLGTEFRAPTHLEGWGIWRVRYIRAGESTIREVNLPNLIVQSGVVSSTTGGWFEAVPGSTADSLEYRWPESDARVGRQGVLNLRAASAGYRLMSLEGVNESFGPRNTKLDGIETGAQRNVAATFAGLPDAPDLWQDHYLYLSTSTTPRFNVTPTLADLVTLTADDMRRFRGIEIVQRFTFSRAHFGLELPINGIWIVFNRTNKIVRCYREGWVSGNLFADVQIGKAAVVGRAGPNCRTFGHLTSLVEIQLNGVNRDVVTLDFRTA